MRVAREMGRPLMEVAHDSFALTLYTAWQLDQLDAQGAFAQTLRAHDLASLISFSFNAPDKLPDLRSRYVALFVPPPSPAERALDESRLHRLLRDHQRLVPISGDETPA